MHLAVWSTALDCLLRAARECVGVACAAGKLEGLAGSAAAAWEIWMDGVAEREWWQASIASPAWLQARPPGAVRPEWIAAAAIAWQVWLGCGAGADKDQALPALIQLYHSATGNSKAATAGLQSDLELISNAVGCARKGGAPAVPAIVGCTAAGLYPAFIPPTPHTGTHLRQPCAGAAAAAGGRLGCDRGGERGGEAC